MRRMLFLLLVLPFYAVAQPSQWDIFLSDKNIDSLGQRIRMPEKDYNPNFTYAGERDYKQKTGSFVISADSVYKQFFWRYIYTNDSLTKYKRSGGDEWWYKWMEKHHIDSLPPIDFSKYELVIYSACYQCLAVCKHSSGNESCHRNACHFGEEYFLRKKIQPVVNRE